MVFKLAGRSGCQLLFGEIYHHQIRFGFGEAA